MNGRGELSSARAVIALTVLAVFLPVAIVPYAFTDDYPLLLITNGLGSSQWFGEGIVQTASAGGRPLGGLLMRAAFSSAGTIGDLRFIRLIAVVGIASLALLLLSRLVRSGLRPAPAALLSVLVVSLPPFQVYGSWAVMFHAPYAAILGGAASGLSVRAVEATRLDRDRLALATAALLAALLVYQPMAMFFWLFLAVALVGSVEDAPRAVRLVGAHLGVAAVAFLAAFLVLKLGVHQFGDRAPNAARGALATHPLEKARWFEEEPLRSALNLFDLTPSSRIAVLVAGIATAGIGLELRRRARRPLLFAGFGASLILLSYLPNLVIAEKWATYRSQGALAALAALYLGLGALGIGLSLRDWLRLRISPPRLVGAERLALLGATAFVAASAFVAAKNVMMLFVEPQMTELRMLRSQVAALPDGALRVGFVNTGYRSGMTALARYDEFGLASSAQPWTLEPAVLLVLREQGRLGPPGLRPTVELLPWDTAEFPNDVPLINLRGLKDLR